MEILHTIFGSFPESFTTDFKSKYGHKVIKTLTIEATVVIGNNCSSKICKTPRKNIHCKVQFH